MRRRDFISLASGTVATWPLAARAQLTGRIYRIGMFGEPNNPIMGPAIHAFLQELRTLGFIESQNLVVDFRHSSEAPSALAENVAEMARSKVDVIATSTQPALQAAMGTGIPIVTTAVNFDPIAQGYIKSLSQPSGNVTGVVLRQTELAEKQVELMTQSFPERKRLALQWDAISADQFSAAERRAKLFGLDVVSIKLENPPYDIPTAFRRITESDAHFLLNLSSPFFGPHIRTIVDLTIQHRLPAMFIFRGYAELGGLLSYGADNVAMYRQTARYVAKILNGAKPADLPVEQPDKFELIVNLKTAKAIGVELPTSILLRADQVIE